MCGIIAYAGEKDGREIVLKGLKKLDYRGYDSWGIAGISEEKIWLHKTTGTVNTDLVGGPSNITIGHTRWATTGKVNKANAHPQLSNDNKIALVHNGIIDNYLKIKDNLTRKGYEFSSETDTETIPNLIQSHMEGKKEGFIEAFRETLKELQGSYAIAAINNNTLAFARQDSPLVIGVGEKEIYIASDTSPFLDKTNKVIFLDEGDWGYYKDGELAIFDSKDNKKEIKTEEIKWQQEDEHTKKQDFPHYMLKEIYEQPNTILKSAEQPNLEEAKQAIKESSEIFLTGSGTSYNACLAASSFFSKQGKRATPILASEHQDIEHFFDNTKTMIIVSQSGETADLIEVVDKAKAKDVRIIGIINVPGSTLWRKSDIVLGMNAGQEIGVASTKAYTATLIIFSKLTGKQTNEQELSNYLTQKIKPWHSQVKELIKKINKDLFIIGRGEAVSYAKETALKVKEVSYIRAEGMAGGELKHGTLALIEENTPVIAITTPKTRQDLVNNALEIRSRGGYIIGIDKEKQECYDYFIPCKYPILSVIPGQLLAYELSISKGYNPDKPRNLAKSVTVK